MVARQRRVEFLIQEVLHFRRAITYRRAICYNSLAIARILRHLGLPTDLPELRVARAPPLPVEDSADPLRATADATF